MNDKDYSNYKNTVPIGKWQFNGKIGPVRAAWDLYDIMILIAPDLERATFLKECEKHGITFGTAKQQWTICKHWPEDRLRRTPAL